MLPPSAATWILRLAAILGALALALGPAAAQAQERGPRYRADGPGADAYGRSQGYPRCAGLTYLRELGCRVGAFSHFDELFPARGIRAPLSPSRLIRAAAEPVVRYDWAGETRSLDR
jgi:hypothetical protein